jgi:hypothetical protein
MKLQSRIALIVVILPFVAAPGHAQLGSANTPDLSGVWKLNRAQSDIPEHVGFGIPRRGGSSGRAGSVDSGNLAGGGGGQFDEPKDAKVDEFTNEAQNPSPVLTIKQTESDVTLIDFQGRIRTLHATGQKQTQQLSSSTVESATRWDGPRLVTEYDLGSGRKVTYTYLLEQPKRLLVLVKFESRGAAPIVREVYDGALGQ